MKTNVPQRLLMFSLLIFFYGIKTSAQVGINTTTPQPGAILDIESSNKGMLVPRVDIANLNTIAPITGGATESLLVYNTNAATGVGFHYWTGSLWFPLNSNDWKASGNVGTNPLTNYIGTADNVDLSFRTNNNLCFSMSTDGGLNAQFDGNATNPVYTWGNDGDTGLWRPGADQLALGAGGLEFLTLQEGATDQFRINNNGANLDTRISSLNQTNTLFVDGDQDNLGLGTNTPNASAQLDLADTDRGILVNRVALNATNNAAPVTSPATGLLVYNTASSSSGNTEVIPGFYYWDGSQWVAMGGTNGRDWSLEGNAGTNPANNFLGTTDNTSLVLRTNNNERMRVLNNGQIAVNTTTPFAGDRFTVQGNSGEYAFNAYASGTGVASYAQNTGSGDASVSLNFGTGLGLFAYAANTHGVYGTTPYTGGAFLTGGIIGWGSGNDNANGVLAVSDKQVSSQSNMGLRAVSGSTTSISSTQVLNVGVNSNATDLALYALSEGPITSTGTMEAARFQSNYTGTAIDSDSRDPRAQLAGYWNNATIPTGTANIYYGAYLYSGGSSANSSYAYAGARYGGANYKIIGNGTVSTIVEGADGNDKVMFAPEAPEVLFEDYGSGQLMNGQAVLSIDPDFSNNIEVSSAHPLRVFIQLEDDCNGVFVTDKSAQGFKVQELSNGTSNVSFSWHIVANRKNEGGSDADAIARYSELRFPAAPDLITPTNNMAMEMDKKQPSAHIMKQ